MTKESLFSPIEGEVTDTHDSEDGVSYRERLVGEGKKFKTDEDMAKGKWAADQLIVKLQNELKGIREDLNARLSVEEFINKMKQEKVTTGNQAPQEPEGDSRKNEQPQPKTISSDDISKLVAEHVSKSEEQKNRKTNVDFTRKELQKAWGSNYPERLKQEADKLGVTEDFLAVTAETNPQVLLKLFNITTSTNDTFSNTPKTKVASSVNSFVSNADKEIEELNKLRKTNPKKYWSRDVQMYIHKKELEKARS